MSDDELAPTPKRTPSRGKSTPSRGKGTVDPRMRARRIDVSRGRARRRLRVVVGAGVTVALVALALAVYTTPLLGVRNIEINGVNDTSAQAIRETIDDVEGTPVLRVDDGDLKDRVAALPGMADAAVTVSMLGTVTVTVSDDRPVAYVPTTEATAALVGPTGRVLSLSDSVPQDLVRIEATVEPSVGGAVPQPTQPAVEVAAALPADLVAVTVAVGVGDDGVELELAHEVRATIGTTEDLTRKLDSVATLLSGRVTLDCLAEVNVTEPSLVTVRRDGSCTGSPV